MIDALRSGGAGRALLYGAGVFTTIYIGAGELFLWDKHWQRLIESSRKLKIDLSAHSKESTRRSLEELIGKNKLANGRARLTFFDERSSEIWPGLEASGGHTSLSIILCERRPVPEPFRLTTSPYPLNSRSPLAGLKSCNYLDKLLALDEAKSRGFDEAVMLNERGKVASAVMANLFWLKVGQLFTPSLKTGCLAGTTREYVLENLECREVEVSIEELDSVDAIFLTSAGIGIVAVSELDGKRLARTSHPIMALVSRPGES